MGLLDRWMRGCTLALDKFENAENAAVFDAQDTLVMTQLLDQVDDLHFIR